MDVRTKNELLSRGRLDDPGLFPHLELLDLAPRRFDLRFGLDQLPEDPGVLFIRGPRQYGKSTWLEGELKKSAALHGAGSSYYLNGDELKDGDELASAIRELVPMLHAGPGPRRLFIDEVTAARDWVKGLKRVLDSGELRSVLVVTTGSRAHDLRRGSERLPGRKGRLARTTYLLTPVSYREFLRVCGEDVGDDALAAYLLAGGCPLACGEIAATGALPEHVTSMIRDWVLGENAATGRSRASLLAVMDVIIARGGSPLGQALLAREAGLANNTVAAGYIELLADLMCLGISHVWDPSRRVRNARKEAKLPFVNVLAAVSFHRGAMRRAADFRGLTPGEQGRWLEWLVAQELWRRAAIRGEEMPEMVPHYRTKSHELDFVTGARSYIEVKRGRASPMDFAWVSKALPGARVVVVNQEPFDAGAVRGMTFEQFLSDESCDLPD